MKKRSFRLQKVLDVRELVEKDCQKALSLSKGKLKSEQEKLRYLERVRHEAAKKMHNIEKAEVSSFVDHHAYVSALNESISNKRKEIESIKLDVERKRLMLLDASKERKALDKLREKHAIEEMMASGKAEQTFLDEVAMRKNNRL